MLLDNYVAFNLVSPAFIILSNFPDSCLYYEIKFKFCFHYNMLF